MKNLLEKPLLFSGITSLLLFGVILAGLAGVRAYTHAAAAANTNCTLIVPVHPLSAQGLATPYQLKATDADQGPCHEANPDQAAFVQGAIIGPDGKIAIYNPLVIDAGT